jgi:hypothetical protein
MMVLEPLFVHNTAYVIERTTGGNMQGGVRVALTPAANHLLWRRLLRLHRGRFARDSGATET